MVFPLATLAQQFLAPLPDVRQLTSLKRAASIFSQDERAEHIYFLEQGLVKLTRSNHQKDRIILAISGPGHVVGIEALSELSQVYYSDAEVLTPCTVYQVPRDTLKQVIAANSEFSASLMLSIIEQKHALAEKVELLCLHDVEYRILHYLAELADLIEPGPNGAGHQLPITQLEFADLIGATRETTSTTLNQLERRGLIKLSRRLLTIESPSQLRAAAMMAKMPAEEATADDLVFSKQ